ncbi:DUF6680 family protein [Claveliimonas bilis]|uniref:DUF6680 domain-containing protein n=1 Tax=Claveliimonas bilis TaxID=3028070 RepID=A0ABM8IA03_9FIRM|nr:DUF6680 family protein [Claveliimonas bilis]BDZ76968.1 hypothetical protein Lac1_11510 [Claveliimonas bilis]
MSVQQAIVTLIGAIISGVLATCITIFINHRTEKIKLKQQLVDDIFGYKYQLTNSSTRSGIDVNANGFVRAMNRIPVVFNDEESILQAYDKFYDKALIADTKERSEKMNEALMDLLKLMCHSAHIKCDNWNDSRFKRTFNV